MAKATSLPIGAVLNEHKSLVQLAVAVLGLAWLLTKTTASVLGNLPLALLAIISLKWLLYKLERQHRARLLTAKSKRGWRTEPQPLLSPLAGATPGSSKPDAWRRHVRAPVVEEAWSRFCGSIVQEFIYDIWYTTLTPDKEFPAEVRRLLNAAFGQLALRGRQLDLRLVMNDLAELFMEQLELYRDTRESILLATQEPNCLKDMSPAARDRAFAREMQAEKNLHPALQTPDGHYKFLRAVSEGAVAYLLDREDSQRTAPRAVCRELLAACVFRPLLMWATPYYANKALYVVLRETQQTQVSGQKEAEELSTALAAARSQAMRGHWEFEQRLRQHVAAEDSALLEARELRHRLRSKLQHSRSKSVDLPPPKLGEPVTQQQQQQQQQRAHLRARSCSPADIPGVKGTNSSSPSNLSPLAASIDGASQGSSQRGRSVAQAGQPRPPRPPLSQQHSQVQQQQPSEERPSPFDMTQLASAVAALLPGSSLAAQHQQQPENGEETPRLAAGWRLPAALGGLVQQRGRLPAEEAEAALGAVVEGDGWESVETSEASLSLPRRDFSSAHLLAPQVDHAAVAGVEARPSSSSSSAGGSARGGFIGTPRAKVVAADLNTTSSKDFVEFKIRVADDMAEWTVSRRYRNFESLHRQLRAYAAYRLKLPPKRIFVHSNNVEFVEERREALDRYLQALLTHAQLSQCADLYEFLRSGSQLYELMPAHRLQTSRSQGVDRPQQRKMLGGMSRAVLDSTQSVGRGVASASGTVKQGVTELACVATGSVGRVTTGVAGAAGAAAGMARRVRSVPSGLDRASGDSIEEGSPPDVAKRGSSGSALPREKRSGLLSRASNRLRSAITTKEPSLHSHQVSGLQQQLEPSGHSGSGSSIASEQPDVQPMSSSRPPSFTALGDSPGKKASKLFGVMRRSKSRSSSPVKYARDRSPTRKGWRTGDTGSLSGSRRNSSDLAVPGDDSAAVDEGLPAHLVSSLRATSPEPSSPLASFPVEPSLEMDDCAGISDPLYEIFDCVFQLQTRGFFRRQVFAVARQVLSLVAGEAIDAYLTSKLRLLRQQHTVGRIISQIQASLWPGGVWFQYAPAAQAAAAAAASPGSQEQQQQQQAAGKSPSVAASHSTSDTSSSRYVRPAGMAAEKFLEPSGPRPLDDDEVREAVEALLLRRAPTTLVRLIGKGAYASGMRDLFDMLNSQTFCYQLGYGCMEIAIVHLFPELKSLFRTLSHGGLG